MQYCTNCGKELPDGAAFCSSCGTPQSGGVSQASASPSMNSAEGLLSENEIVMKKKILSLREHYDFEDRSGRKLGEGDGNLFQIPAKFVVKSSPDGQELLHINGKLISIRHEFDFLDSRGNHLGSMKKKIVKLIGNEYWVEKNGQELMRVFGNFTEHDYNMSINGQLVAQVHKKWISVRDQFGLSIIDDVDRGLVIGAVIVVEHIEVTEKQNS
jgi:uncharacterized protein YxjI